MKDASSEPQEQPPRLTIAQKLFKSVFSSYVAQYPYHSMIVLHIYVLCCNVACSRVSLQYRCTSLQKHSLACLLPRATATNYMIEIKQTRIIIGMLGLWTTGLYFCRAKRITTGSPFGGLLTIRQYGFAWTRGWRQLMEMRSIAESIQIRTAIAESN